MVGLIDIAPLTKTVTIRNVPVDVSGVSARGIAQLLARFPELRALMAGREVAIEGLLARPPTRSIWRPSRASTASATPSSS